MYVFDRLLVLLLYDVHEQLVVLIFLWPIIFFDCLKFAAEILLF